MRTVLPLALAALALSTPALAQDGGGSGSWDVVVGAATDNRSKNASKSDGDPFVYGLAEWSSADGRFYANPGFETIKSPTGSELEVQVGAGYRPQFAGFDLDLSVVHKWQVDAEPGTDADAFEFTADASRSVGPASARLQLQHSPDGTASTEAWTWVEARLGWDFTDKLEATAAIGRREQHNNVDYTGWNAGVTYAVTQSLEFDLRWFDTDANEPGERYEGTLVAGVNLYF